jgi:hypothetical protein
MCLQGACPCLAGGNTGGWGELTPEVLLDTYESTRTPSSFYFTADGYDSYDNCIKTVKEDEVSAEFWIFAKGFRDQDDFAEIEDYIKFFEEEYSCAGICSPALFYFYRSVSEGVPGGSCLLSIQDDLKTSLIGVGGAALASGIFLFFTFIFQYCLWRKYDEE